MASSNIGNAAGNLARGGGRMARSAAASPAMTALMRLGYATRGLVYVIIGVLALETALGMGGALTDPQGAIVAMGNTSSGSVILYIALVGLIGYALWGVIRAVFDPLHKGADAKGIATRLGYLVSGVSYALLAVATLGLINGTKAAARSGAQTTQTQNTTASILANSWGPWLVGLAGVIVVVIGLSQIVQGFRGTFDQQFEPYAMSATQRTWIDRLGRFGTAARGIVFALIGVFLVLAAYTNDPKQAQGINGVLASLLHQPFGPWLLGFVALGLLAFGIYSMLGGLWLRFKR